MSGVELRPIVAADDAAVAAIIRSVMTEHGASGAGFAIHDAEVDAMTDAYSRARHLYLVLDHAGVVLGGGGIGPLVDGPEDVCELRKMYFLPDARGLGLGRTLLDRLLAAARERGFRRCYLETLGSMTRAGALYAKAGFRRIDGPMGATGHFACNAFYERDL